jgi:hypothetical protein
MGDLKGKKACDNYVIVNFTIHTSLLKLLLGEGGARMIFQQDTKLA